MKSFMSEYEFKHGLKKLKKLPKMEFYTRKRDQIVMFPETLKDRKVDGKVQPSMFIMYHDSPMIWGMADFNNPARGPLVKSDIEKCPDMANYLRSYGLDI